MSYHKIRNWSSQDWGPASVVFGRFSSFMCWSFARSTSKSFRSNLSNSNSATRSSRFTFSGVRSGCAKPSVTLGGGVFKSPGHVSFLKLSRQSDKQSQFWHMNARLMTLCCPKLCAGQTFPKSLFSLISVALQFTHINPHFIGICGDPTTPVDGEGVKPQKMHRMISGKVSHLISCHTCVCDSCLASMIHYVWDKIPLVGGTPETSSSSSLWPWWVASL